MQCNAWTSVWKVHPDTGDRQYVQNVDACSSWEVVGGYGYRLGTHLEGSGEVAHEEREKRSKMEVHYLCARIIDSGKLKNMLGRIYLCAIYKMMHRTFTIWLLPRVIEP